MHPFPLVTYYTTDVETIKSIMQSIPPVVLESLDILESRDFRDNPGADRLAILLLWRELFVNIPTPSLMAG